MKMKRIGYLLILCSLFFVMSGCEKDTEPVNFAPKLTTGKAESVYRTGVTLSGSIEKTEGVVVKEYGILYSTLQSMAEYTEVRVNENGEKDFVIRLQNLESDKTYYYCAYAYSGYSIAKGEVYSFTTGASNTPVFSSLEISNTDEKSFVASTSILDEGGGDIFLSGFCWKETPVADYIPTERDETANISDESQYQMRIKDLKPGRQYAIRAYAVSSKGIGYGETAYVITKATDFPVVSSSVPQDSTATSITLLARILANGTTVTEKGFCYSAEIQEPTIKESKEIVQTPDTTIYGTIDGLKPGSTYYIRAYAVGHQGIGYGDIMTFTIPDNGQQVIPPTVTTLSAEDMGTGMATLTGSIAVEDLDDIASFGFVWESESSPVEHVVTENYPSEKINRLTGIFTLTLGGLPVEERIRVYAWAIKEKDNQNVRGQGESIDFTIAPVVRPAVVGRTTVNDIAIHTASVAATVSDNGGSVITASGFCYSAIHLLPDEQDIRIASLTAGNGIMANLTELEEGQTYYIRAYAVNKVGISYGEVNSFQTKTGISVVVPVLSETMVTEIAETSAKVSATVVNNGGASVFDKGFCYSLTNNLPSIESSNVITDTSAGNAINGILENLEPNTRYYIRAYATNSEGTAYGTVKEFHTMLVTVPAVSGLQVVNIRETAIDVSATIDSDGGSAIISRGFCYSSTNKLPVTTDLSVVSEDMNSVFTSTITNLSPETTYYVRAFATNAKGTAYSEAYTVKTLPETTSGIPDVDDNEPPVNTRTLKNR